MRVVEAEEVVLVLDRDLLVLEGGVFSTKSSLESAVEDLLPPGFFLGCGEFVVELALELFDNMALLLFLPE